MKLVDIAISKRLWAAVTLPMLAAGYLSYVQLSARLDDYHNMNDVVVISEQLKKLSDIAHSLQVERGLTAGFIGSKGTKNVAELSGARAQTDGATGQIDAISASLSEVNGGVAKTQYAAAEKISNRLCSCDSLWTVFPRAVVRLLAPILLQSRPSFQLHPISLTRWVTRTSPVRSGPIWS